VSPPRDSFAFFHARLLFLPVCEFFFLSPVKKERLLFSLRRTPPFSSFSPLKLKASFSRAFQGELFFDTPPLVLTFLHVTEAGLLPSGRDRFFLFFHSFSSRLYFSARRDCIAPTAVPRRYISWSPFLREVSFLVAVVLQPFSKRNSSLCLSSLTKQQAARLFPEYFLSLPSSPSLR